MSNNDWQDAGGDHRQQMRPEQIRKYVWPRLYRAVRPETLSPAMRLLARAVEDSAELILVPSEGWENWGDEHRN
jgi:hypothetical protein